MWASTWRDAGRGRVNNTMSLFAQSGGRGGCCCQDVWRRGRDTSRSTTPSEWPGATPDAGRAILTRYVGWGHVVPARLCYLHLHVVLSQLTHVLVTSSLTAWYCTRYVYFSQRSRQFSVAGLVRRYTENIMVCSCVTIRATAVSIFQETDGRGVCLISMNLLRPPFLKHKPLVRGIPPLRREVHSRLHKSEVCSLSRKVKEFIPEHAPNSTHSCCFVS